MITAILKDIFLPKKIKNFYLFTQRIVAFELQTHKISATIVRAHREKRTIQKFLEESYEAHNQDSLETALKNLVQRMGAYDSAYVALPSSLAVFKTITLPFTHEEKIKLILPFEVESLLPFSLQEAIIDALVYPAANNAPSSEVFVTAVKRSILDATLQPFFNAGIRPEKVTVGAIELYGLIANSALSQPQGVSCIIDFAPDTTTIMLLVRGKLRTIRALSEGLSEEDARLDFGAPNQLPEHIRSFFATIQFTVLAMIKTNVQDVAQAEHSLSSPAVDSVIITGVGAQYTNMNNAISTLLNCPCTVFQPHKLLHEGSLVLENKNSIPAEYTISLATALSSPTTENFNLGTTYQEPYNQQLFKYQVITAAALLLSAFVIFGLFSFFNTRTLRNEIDALKEQTRKVVASQFNIEINKRDSIDTMVRNAQQKLTMEKGIWFALSQNQRRSFLFYLQELETHINPDELGLDMKRLSLKRDDTTGEDIIRLEGSVRDFYAAVKFTEDLKKTNLFVDTDITPLQNTTFDIRLVVNKHNEVNG